MPHLAMRYAQLWSDRSRQLLPDFRKRRSRALKPCDSSFSRSRLPETTAPSKPAFSAIWRSGAMIALRTMSIPRVWSSLSPSCLRKPWLHKEEPYRRRGRCLLQRPRGLRAAHHRRGPCVLSLRLRVEPPTLITATPPASFASVPAAFLCHNRLS